MHMKTYLVKQRNFIHLWEDEYYLVKSASEDFTEDEFNENLHGDAFAEKVVQRKYIETQETTIGCVDDLCDFESDFASLVE